MKFSGPSFPFGRFVLTVLFILVAVPCSLAEESSKKEQRLIKQLEQVTEVRTKYLAKMAEAEKGLREVERRMMELQLQLRPQTQPSQEQASIQ